MENLGWILGAAAVGGLLAWWRLSRSARGVALERLEEGLVASETKATGVMQRGMRTWLQRAGYRAPSSLANFWIAQAGAVALAALPVYWMEHTAWVESSIAYASEVPGGFGELFVPVIELAPWIAFVIVASLPLLQVRASRRRLVAEVEQDLPFLLELLATLGEAGLGFDAALNRVLQQRDPGRPLVRELRGFQRDALAGFARVQALRRMAHRLEVANVSTFVSSLIQSEQGGAALATTLRRQADDLWNRRRERALALSQALPVKLSIPLVLCFLPGIFVMVLGPAFLDFFQLVDTVLSGSS